MRGDGEQGEREKEKGPDMQRATQANGDHHVLP